MKNCPAENPHCRHKKEEGRCDYCGFDFDAEHLTAESLEIAKQEAAYIAQQKVLAEQVEAAHAQELNRWNEQLGSEEKKLAKLEREHQLAEEESARLRQELERSQSDSSGARRAGEELSKKLKAEENKTRQLQQDIVQAQSSRDTMALALKEAQQKLDVALKQVQEKSQKFDQLEKLLNHEAGLKRTREKERDDASKRRDELAQELTAAQGKLGLAASAVEEMEIKQRQIEKKNVILLFLIAVLVLAVGVATVISQDHGFQLGKRICSESVNESRGVVEATTAQLTKALGLGLVSIPVGCFNMGSPAGEMESYGNESPQHRACVSAFELGKHEVTQAQWKMVMGTNPNYFNDCGDDCPVVRVSWNEIQSFLKKLNELTGKSYRLPSEAEWEYAARAGTQTRYWWGDEIGWNNANCDGCGMPLDKSKTIPVGNYKANPWGLHDMYGNVFEWVQDCWHDSYDGAPRDGSAWEGNCTENGRVIRGGAWSSSPGTLRSASRNRSPPNLQYTEGGFRLALTLL